MTQQKQAAMLTYYIFEGVLAGLLNGTTISISAVTGCGGGSTKHAPAASMNNPYMYGLKTVGTGAHHQHGGPIPLGCYKISAPAQHPHLGLSARLDPERPLQNNRGGFFIHNRGPHGSDGCIVPTDPSKFHQLMHGLTVTHGGTLVVVENMSGTRFA
jgi:hypothetical protein